MTAPGTKPGLSVTRRRRPGWPTTRRRSEPAQRAPAPVAPPGRRRSARNVPVTPATAYPRRRRTVLLFAGGLVVSVVVLVLLAYVVGHGPDIGLGGFVESVLSAATGKVTGTALAFVVLGCAAWCVQRLWLERLAWRPGQVVIPVFSEGSKLTDANAVHLTAQFRQRFASLRLQSPAPVPGAAPEGDFLQVLGQKSLDGKNPLGSALALLYAAKPTHAYVVHGVLVERAEHPRYGVTVQVVRRPEEGAPPETVYDISWERAVRRAADRAMAHILPRTRRCDAPWASWRGFVMPAALLESYEAAAAFEQERRYDEALAQYYRAVELDPMNLALRLHIGHLQEKLGLYVDALATYEGMLAVADAAAAAPNVGVFAPIAQRERDRVLLLGRYRRVVLLGGPLLARQWRHTSSSAEWTERDDQRADLRDRLRPRLSEHLRKTAAELEPLNGGARPPAPAELLAEPERPYGERDDDPVLDQLRRLLVHHALDELAALRAKLASFTKAHRDALPSLTDASLRLTEVSIRERCTWIERQLTRPQKWIWGAEDVDRLERAVADATGGTEMLRWHERYNAACAFALPLLVTDDPEPAVRDALAGRAVQELEKATSCADSGYIATRRDWLLSEDPDLAGLRAHGQFKAFEAMYFPAAGPTPRRPRLVQPLEVSSYARDLIDATATRWHTEWHERRQRESLQDPHELVTWWQHEAQVWQLVGRAAWNHRRWRVRYDLLETVDDLSVAYDGEPLKVAFRAFEAPWMCATSEAKVDRLAKAALEDTMARLQGVARKLAPAEPRHGGFRVDGIDEWIDRLRDKDAAGDLAKPEDVVALCDRHAAVWERLHVWMTAAEGEDVATAAERFTAQLEKLTHQLHDAG